MSWLLPYFIVISCLNMEARFGPYDSIEDAQYYREAFWYDYSCTFDAPIQQPRWVEYVSRYNLVDFIRPYYIKSPDQQFRDWVNEQVTLGVWSGMNNRYYREEPPLNTCHEAWTNYIRTLTLAEFRRQRATPGTEVFEWWPECYCNQMGAVNCKETWVNHAPRPAYGGPWGK